ncbi:MAG: hypothetical protein ACRCYT_06670 [Cetobacterium sp.]
MLNAIFLIILIVLCAARFKGMCGTCEGSKSGDIFQIFSTGILIMWLVGITPAVKITGIILVISVIRYFLFKPKKKKDDGIPKKDRSCCEDNFK